MSYEKGAGSWSPENYSKLSPHSKDIRNDLGVEETNRERFLLSLKETTFTPEQQQLLVGIFDAGKTCNVVRSNSDRQDGTLLGIDPAGRIKIGFLGTRGENLLKHVPVDTFINWQEAEPQDRDV